LNVPAGIHIVTIDTKGFKELALMRAGAEFALGCFACLMASFQLAALTAGAADDSPAEFDPAEVIAYQGDVVLRQADIDAAFSKIPEEDRLRFIRDGSKVDQLIRVLLQRKVIAAEAKKVRYDQDDLVAARMQLEAERELAEAWMQEVMRQMPPADYEALAHEDYLANPGNYRSEGILDVSHILISTKERSPAEAKAIAETVFAKLEADPKSFDQLVVDYSDDPAKINNGGRYHEMTRGMMAAAFEEAAFNLNQPGEISKPVQTSYGWHIIRLNERSGNELPAYEEVKDEAIERARQQHLESYRGNYMRRILTAPVVVPPEAVEIMAKRHFGENLELAPNARR